MVCFWRYVPCRWKVCALYAVAGCKGNVRSAFRLTAGSGKGTFLRHVLKSPQGSSIAVRWFWSSLSFCFYLSSFACSFTRIVHHAPSRSKQNPFSLKLKYGKANFVSPAFKCFLVYGFSVPIGLYLASLVCCLGSIARNVPSIGKQNLFR